MEKDVFNLVFDQLVEVCRKPEVQLSSSMGPLRLSEPYRKIVAMGYKALPFIRKAYDLDSSNDFALSIVQGHGLVGLVEGIVGNDFTHGIPREMTGRIDELEAYTKRWLDQNMRKYVPGK